MDKVKVILPPVADKSAAIDSGLVSLTEAIFRIAPEKVHHGILGGRFGYGADFENDVFEMRPDSDIDCICPDDMDPDLNQDHVADCPFSHPNFRHKATGFSVWWYKWIGRGMETKNDAGTNPQMIFEECVASVAPRPAPGGDGKE